MEEKNTDYIKIGVITTTHGLKGEVKVFPLTDDPSRYEQLEEVLLDTKKGLVPLTITSVRYFKNLVILKFKEFNDINEVEQYKKMELFIKPEQAVELDEGEYFISDLIGLLVETKEGPLGKLVDVLSTAANDIYVVKLEDGEELLIPAIKECILQVDLKESKMLVHLLKGLREVNEKKKS